MNIIVITLDALSARYMDIYEHDHFSPHFKEKAKTPFLRELLKDSVKYTKAYTNSNMTIVATREILEARMVSLPWEEKSSAALPFQKTNLSKVLKECGYKTGALLGSGENWVFEGFPKEFDFCLNTSRPFDGLMLDGIDWIEENKKEPFFFWVHSKETHMGFNYQYIDAPCGLYENWDDEFSKFIPEEHICLKGLDLNKNLMMAFVKSVTFCDKHIGVLLNYLKESGLYDETMIVISADHGSTYGDVQSKHYAQHSNTVENVFNIPLIVKYPNSQLAGTINDNLCQTIDIPYTIVKETGNKPPLCWEGESLKDLTKKYVIMECNPGCNMFGIKTADWLCQYILPKFYTRVFNAELDYLIKSIKPFLYHRNNPTLDVYSSYPDIVSQFKNILEKHFGRKI